MNPGTRIERLEYCVEAYGGDPARWPPADAAALAALPPAQARALLGAASELDEWLAALPEPDPPAGLSARILAGAPVPRERLLHQLWQALGGLRVAGPAFACALSLGLAIGLAFAPIDTVETDELEAWLALASVDTDYEEDLP